MKMNRKKGIKLKDKKMRKMVESIKILPKR